MSVMNTQALAIGRRDRANDESSPTWGDVFDERAPLLGAPAFFGPPVIYVLGPWLLFVLLLAGPFALILTVALVVTAVVGAVAVLVAVIASPWLLVRHLQQRGRDHPRPRALLHLLRNSRVSSARLGSPQPKGVS